MASFRIGVTNFAKRIIPSNAYSKMRDKKRALLRKIGPIQLGDYSSAEPVSRHFGHERGKSIDRYYIEKFLKSNANLIKGNVMEIEENTYTAQFGNPDIKSFVLKYEGNDNLKQSMDCEIVIGNLTKPETIPEGNVDCFICTQTLNFIYDVKSAIKSIYQSLKWGGVLLVTVAGISQLSERDYTNWGDYYRFSDMGIRKHFEAIFGVGNVEVYPFGNIATTLAFLQGFACEDLKKEMFDYVDPYYAQVIGVIAYKR